MELAPAPRTEADVRRAVDAAVSRSWDEVRAPPRRALARRSGARRARSRSRRVSRAPLGAPRPPPPPNHGQVEERHRRRTFAAASRARADATEENRAALELAIAQGESTARTLRDQIAAERAAFEREKREAVAAARAECAEDVRKALENAARKAECGSARLSRARGRRGRRARALFSPR